MNETFTKEKWLREEVKAYKKCDGPECDNGTNFRALKPCHVCQGEGGKWHGAVVGWGESERLSRRVYRSSILYRYHKPCGECGGRGTVCEDIPVDEPCPYCLQDSDGNPTGAAVGTGQGWEVEK